MKLLWRGPIGLGLFVAGALVGGLVVHLSASPTRHSDVPPRRWEATVFLPVVDNAGKHFSDETWQHAVGKLATDFGGATVAGEQEGWWLDRARQLHREPVRPVVVSFSRHRLGQFRQTVREVGRRLGQVELYVRLEEPRVEVVPVEGGILEKER